MAPARLKIAPFAAAALALAACGGPSASPAESTPAVAESAPAAAESAPAAAESAPAAVEPSEAPAGEQYVANAADFVDAADWDTAQTVTIQLSEFAFTPNDITLEAGRPYVLEVVNVGTAKHEFTAEAFFRTVATRKAETAESEVKVPYFTEIEVFAGKTAEIFLIPLIPGTYDLVCEIEGHYEAGMFGTITVTGTAPAAPAVELADVADGAWVQDGPAVVEAADWESAEELTIELSEYAFSPTQIDLVDGQPYVVTVVNMGEVKHEFTAEGFFGSVAFRKAEDASGEFKAPAPREIEVFAGQQIEIFLVPTAEGDFDLVCEIEGHYEAGMFGSITVGG